MAIFISALVIKTMFWKQPICPSANEWINEMHLHNGVLLSHKDKQVNCKETDTPWGHNDKLILKSFVQIKTYYCVTYGDVAFTFISLQETTSCELRVTQLTVFYLRFFRIASDHEVKAVILCPTSVKVHLQHRSYDECLMGSLRARAPSRGRYILKTSSLSESLPTPPAPPWLHLHQGRFTVHPPPFCYLWFSSFTWDRIQLITYTTDFNLAYLS